MQIIISVNLFIVQSNFYMLPEHLMLVRFIYSFLLFLLAPFFLYGLYKNKTNKPKFGKRWVEHFGFCPELKDNNTTALWIHTVSVGEVIAATPLIKALKKQQPQQTIVVTTTTSTGAAEVKKLENLVEHRYMPLDFSGSVKRFIKIINPTALLIMETELWPNTLHTVHQHKIPIIIINARLSHRSYLRYQKFQFIFDMLAKNIDQLLCQTEADAQRFIKLGINKEKIEITGSIKFDISITDQLKTAGTELRSELGEKRPIWIASSTHQGEDELILKAHQVVLKKVPEALLIIVPRHPERFLTVTDLAKNNGFNTVSRTSKQSVCASTSVYIADTMGEMLTLIGAADICFMGGSLLGKKVGGHNLLEPAALAKPCLTGDSFYNFQLITEQLIESGGCIVCPTESDLADNLLKLFADETAMREMGRSALAVVDKNRGALARTLKELSAITAH
ncbi:MAG: 3-deoxy-D-manno-octulosonic-acid transferase [Psychromonas sp.]|jgi:3-deoxy-D-manno-octulosonic-acid transferase|uniref:lipid IV(A) 3-deoxy-D-manno-octulosonic acid transferase n=1 Tax=Psychromonas sp. TaxID=1884585 RepID=UPI0039E27EBF